MKTFSLLFAFALSLTLLSAQEKFTVPQLTDAQESEVLYSHVIAYSVTGISFAKSHGVSPEDYGHFIGEKFTAYWNSADGFPMLVNRLMFILAGIHPDNDLQIIEQDAKSIRFKLKNVDAAFKNGPMFDVSYTDFLDCSYGIISTISNFMQADFSHSMSDDGWYIVHLKSK